MEIMPIEKAYEVSEVVKYLKTCEEFRDIRGGRARETSHQRRLSFEYVLLKDKNDSQKHASDIAAMLKGLDCRVNVIPFSHLQRRRVQKSRACRRRGFLRTAVQTRTKCHTAPFARAGHIGGMRNVGGKTQERRSRKGKRRLNTRAATQHKLFYM